MLCRRGRGRLGEEERGWGMEAVCGSRPRLLLRLWRWLMTGAARGWRAAGSVEKVIMPNLRGEPFLRAEA